MFDYDYYYYFEWKVRWCKTFQKGKGGVELTGFNDPSREREREKKSGKS